MELIKELYLGIQVTKHDVFLFNQIFLADFVLLFYFTNSQNKNNNLSWFDTEGDNQHILKCTQFIICLEQSSEHSDLVHNYVEV